MWNYFSKIFSILIILFLLICCQSQNHVQIYKSAQIEIIKLTNNTYRHVSYLETQKFGKVSCNGLIFIDSGEAIIIDTPSNIADAKELINWVEESLKCKIKFVVPTHFHIDCLGGLEEFHNRSISSYAYVKTIEFAKRESMSIPQNGFDDVLELPVGNEKVHIEYLGEGHTRDNVVCYVPSDQVLFGGCLVKGVGASKGNLEDANVEAWPRTVANVKDTFPDAKIIVPGHGAPGGQGLLDYSKELFNKE